MAMITCENLAFAYNNSIVLEDINFTVEEGDYLSVVGENGSGKSTLVKGLLGLKQPVRGTLRYGDGLKAREIGYLPQQNQIQRDFPATVFEIVQSGRLNSLGWRPFYNKTDKKAAHDTMERLGIRDLSHRSFRELSGGQQQRVLLARALVATKKLLLLDEPLAGLDPIVSGSFYKLLDEVNRSGISVIMVSHDIHPALHHANKVLHLGQQQLFFGSSKDYKETDLGKRFLGYSKEDYVCA